MNQGDNPIVQKFISFRAALASCLSVSRDDIRPESELAELIPLEQRREVWRTMRGDGFRLPALERSGYWERPARAAVIPLGIRTMWQMAAYLTGEFPDFPWSKREIEFKVRLIIAEVLSLTVDIVRPECSLRELGAD